MIFESASPEPGVPDDPLAVVRPGDPDPFLGRSGNCTFRWFDHHDEPGHDPAWRCHRDAPHQGQHIATSPGSHVAAVCPGRSVPATTARAADLSTPGGPLRGPGGCDAGSPPSTINAGVRDAGAQCVRAGTRRWRRRRW
jgi:hypothetical protein